MEMPAHIWHLIARTLNGEASSREREELEEILRQDAPLQQQFEILSRVWKEREGISEPERASAERTISRIISKANYEMGGEKGTPGRTGRTWRNSWLVAASILFIAVATWTISKKNPVVSEKEEHKGSIVAQNGSRIRSLLPDGTTVWLNAGSKLHYDDFSGNTREVTLEGEAYFDVVRQPDHPFIVHTSGIDIKVLGTSFNVKSYPEDKNVETTLFHGSVKVFRQNENEKDAVQLLPNEKLILSKDAAIARAPLSQEVRQPTQSNLAEGVVITHLDSTKKENERFETAWIFSRLEFRGDNFEELSKKLERWYNVKVIFADEASKQLSFNGSFEKETVEQAFHALSAAVPFEYNIKGNEIYIGSRS